MHFYPPDAERRLHFGWAPESEGEMIRKQKSGEYRLYSKKKDKSGKRKNLALSSHAQRRRSTNERFSTSSEPGKIR